MVFDINTYYSHPQKPLLKHAKGVLGNIKKFTNSQLAELVAVLHDLGKMNPNFQAKIRPELNNQGYSHHSYLSAVVFFCAFCVTKKNFEILRNLLGGISSQNDIIAILVLLAKHHGNLPDLSPSDYSDTGANILSKTELCQVFDFLNCNESIPFHQFVSQFYDLEDFSNFITDRSTQNVLLNSLYFKSDQNTNPLDFFLKSQHAFACLIHADKADAAKFDNFIDEQKKAVQTFSSCFSSQLDSYLKKLKQDTELNKLRTEIRGNAVQNIHKGLRENRQVFELTAPTGSGKTLMLLSLASEIVKAKGAKRIIYGLPFLSITEQVEAEVLKIFEGYEDSIQRIDSKSENHRFEKIQEELDNNPDEEKIQEANILEFRENTFAFPFIITTFVRFFETLLSNRNAELLKLPNFSNCIFLLDEIQSLPPRLYGFFVAYLSKFCEKFGSYAIISTATQPNFEIPTDNTEAIKFFKDYTEPYALLPLSYFNNNLFNRYQIDFNKEPIDLETLKDFIISENNSTLVILNTIDDTKELYKLLLNELDNYELLLLNTHFTPNDRKKKISFAKDCLNKGNRIILISTQLIEAGVDVDFPVLYRDFTTVASIVQSAGRCNRNGKLNFLGKVKLIKLKRNGKERSRLIFRGRDEEIIKLTKRSFSELKYQEKELIDVQKEFFNLIQKDLIWGEHSQNGINPDFDFIKDITECQYDRIGKFRLIDKQLYGEEFRYYVPWNNRDNNFEILLKLQSELIDLIKENADKRSIRTKNKSIEIQLKKMSGQIIQIRFNRNQTRPLQGSELHYFNLYKIDNSSYTFDKGIDLVGSEFLI